MRVTGSMIYVTVMAMSATPMEMCTLEISTQERLMATVTTLGTSLEKSMTANGPEESDMVTGCGGTSMEILI